MCWGVSALDLTNDEIALSHAMISIPVNVDFNSLNLAQAAAIIAYDFAQEMMNAPDRTLSLGKTVPATAAEFDNFCRRLEEEIDKGGFLPRAGTSPERHAKYPHVLYARRANGAGSQHAAWNYYGD